MTQEGNAACPACAGPGCLPSHLLHDGLLGVLGLHDAGLHEVAHGVVALAPRQDGQAGRGARVLEPLLDAAEGLGEEGGVRAGGRSPAAVPAHAQRKELWQRARGGHWGQVCELLRACSPGRAAGVCLQSRVHGHTHTRSLR